MKIHSLSKLLLAGGALCFACACQPKVQPITPPVAPPQSYESEGCTDQDECSEGASIEAIQDEKTAPTVESTPAVEAPAEKSAAVESVTPAPTADAAPAQEADSAKAEPVAPAAPEETVSTPAPVETPVQI